MNIKIAIDPIEPDFEDLFDGDQDSGDKGEAKRDWPYRVTGRGVWRRVDTIDKKTKEITSEWRLICSELHVLAETRDGDGEEWGRLLKLTDRDGRAKLWAMPMAMLAGDGNAIRDRLYSLGLVPQPSKFARESLLEYIASATPERKARCIGRIGWTGDAFVLPARTRVTRGEPEKIIFQSPAPLADPYRLGGNLRGWQDEIACYAPGNSRLILALSAAFAGPLLFPLATEGGGFHFRGGSSTGKTTLLQVAGSAWGGGGIGGYVRSWRATDNGLEGVAALHCDTLLCLDEIGQVDARKVGEIAYMLANGTGKARAGRTGEARKAAEWRVLFLSSGEISLAQKIAEEGRQRRAMAGQEVRIVDVPADAGAGKGAFEDLHDFPNADAFARHLKTAAAKHHGHAAGAFLDSLVPDVTRHADRAAAMIKSFTEEHCPTDADGQVRRVLARFALVAAAGELATEFGVLPWLAGDASNGAEACFKAWLGARGGIGAAEDRDALATVRRFIEAHGSSRFEAMGVLAPTDGHGNPMEQRIINRAGFKRLAEAQAKTDFNEEEAGSGVEFLFLPEAWKEVCAGLDPGRVARALAARGVLKTGGDGKTQTAARLPGFAKTVRVYAVSSAILSL